MPVIDLNADLGEGGAHDEALIACVSSANIACGWHAGDGATLRAALRACRAQGVAAGAHPSFPDREHFGRQALNRAPDDVHADLVVQIAGLQALAAQEGLLLAHVKLHGALYNQAADDVALAAAVVRAVQACDPTLVLVGRAGSPLLAHARQAGLPVRHEAFADRAYLADGRLAPRGQAGAVLDAVDAALAQGLALASGQPISTLDGKRLTVQAQSLCVHGDGAEALTLVRELRQALQARGWAIAVPAR